MFKLRDFIGSQTLLSTKPKGAICARTSKRVFRSRLDARYQLSTFRDHEQMRVYHCRWCGGWHIGHVL